MRGTGEQTLLICSHRSAGGAESNGKVGGVILRPGSCAVCPGCVRCEVPGCLYLAQFMVATARSVVLCRPLRPRRPSPRDATAGALRSSRLRCAKGRTADATLVLCMG